MAFTVSANEKAGGIFTFILSGSLDSETYTELETKVNTVLYSSPKVVIFDMSDLTYISSMGLTVVLKTKKTLENNKGTFIMINLQPQIKKVFEIAAVLPSLNIFANVEEADNYLLKIQQDEIEKENLS